MVSSEAQLTILRPAFTFGRATNGSGGLALTFPPEATGFVLESSPTLGVGAVWTVVTNLATLPNGQIILPIDPAAGLLFYRLRSAPVVVPTSMGFQYQLIELNRQATGAEVNRGNLPLLPPTELAPAPSSP